MASLHWVDYALFAWFLVISLGVGVYHAVIGKGLKTTQAFIMANRKLRVGPTVMSLLASYISAIAVLGMTAEMFMFGSQMWLWATISTSCSLLMVERVAIPWLYPLKLTSVFQYFELRFKSKTLRMFTSSLGILQGVLYMGIAMYAPSAALYIVTGLPLSSTVPVMAVVCVAYTALGGMRAVIWTDVFQFTVMIGGMLLIAVKTNMIVGGVNKAFDLAHSEGRLVWAKWDPDPRVRHTVWGLCIGNFFHWFAGYGFGQACVQRFSATATINHARKVALLAIPSLVATYGVFFLTGVFIVAYYVQIGCDPVASRQISNGNMLLPDFLNKEFPGTTGFRGVFLAILYGGALSSMSSALSGSAANIWEDFLKPIIPSIDERRATWLNRVIVVILGCLATAFAFLVEQFPGSIIQVSTQILGAVGSPLFGMFMLGGLFRKAVAKGAIAGGVLGCALTICIGLGSLTVKGCHPTLPPMSMANCEPPVNSTTTQDHVVLSGISNLFAISYLWYTPIGAGITIITGLIASYIFLIAERWKKYNMRKELSAKCNRPSWLIPGDGPYSHPFRYFYPNDKIDVPDELFIRLGNLFTFNLTEEDIVNTEEPCRAKADDDNDLTPVKVKSRRCNETMSQTRMKEADVTSSLLRDDTAF